MPSDFHTTVWPEAVVTAWVGAVTVAATGLPWASTKGEGPEARVVSSPTGIVVLRPDSYTVPSASLSRTVTSAVRGPAPPGAVSPEAVACRPTISVPSTRPSFSVGTRTCSEVVPGAKVSAPVSSSHWPVVGLSTSSGVLSTPGVMYLPWPVTGSTVPVSSLRATPTGKFEGWVSESVNTASWPSTTAGPAAICTAGRSSSGTRWSGPRVPVPSSRMVPVPVPLAMPALLGWLRSTWKVSLPS